jgi:hypothetical protein
MLCAAFFCWAVYTWMIASHVLRELRYMKRGLARLDRYYHEVSHEAALAQMQANLAVSNTQSVDDRLTRKIDHRNHVQRLRSQRDRLRLARLELVNGIDKAEDASHVEGRYRALGELMRNCATHRPDGCEEVRGG